MMQESLSKADAVDYGAREAQSGHLKEFAGGDAGGTLVALILIAVIAAFVYLLLKKADKI